MTNAEARCNKSLRPRKPEGSLGRTAQDVHLDSHTAPELCSVRQSSVLYIPNTGEEIQCFVLNTDREMQCPYFEKEKQLDLYLIPAKKSSVFVVVVVLLFVCFNEYRQRNGICFAPNLEINKDCALYRILEKKIIVLCMDYCQRKAVSCTDFGKQRIFDRIIFNITGKRKAVHIICIIYESVSFVPNSGKKDNLTDSQ